MKVVLFLDNGKKANLSVEFKRFVLDYEISWMIEIKTLMRLYGYKQDENRLLSILSKQMSDEMFELISKADYGDGKEECFEMFKQSQQTLKIPKEVDFQMSEILCLYNYTKVKNKEEYIAKSFSLVFSLLGDYNGSIVEDPVEYWLIELCSLSKDFSRGYKEALLSFYIDYLFTKHTFSNPFTLLLFLIIAMMLILDYSQKEIETFFTEFYRQDYVKRYEFHFFPKGTLTKFKEMLMIINDSKKEEVLFKILDEMILEYSDKDNETTAQ